MPYKKRNAITLPITRDEAAIDMVWVSEDVLERERKRKNSTFKKMWNRISTLRSRKARSKSPSTQRTPSVEDEDRIPLMESQD